MLPQHIDSGYSGLQNGSLVPYHFCCQNSGFREGQVPPLRWHMEFGGLTRDLANPVSTGCGRGNAPPLHIKTTKSAQKQIPVGDIDSMLM